MKPGSGGLKLLAKEKEKSLLERGKEIITNKLQPLFAAVTGTTKKGLDFSILTHRIPPEVLEKLKAINSLAALYTDDFQSEGPGLSGSGGVCQRMIYQNRYIFVIKKIVMTNFRDRDYVRLQRELDIQSSLNNRRIPALYHSFYESDAIYLIMQYEGESISKQTTIEREDIITVCSSSPLPPLP